MSDLFHEHVSDGFILEVWRAMRETPRHNYQILTKRPQRMAQFVTTKIKDILPNVCGLATSIENADVVERIDHSARASAAICFITIRAPDRPCPEKFI